MRVGDGGEEVRDEMAGMIMVYCTFSMAFLGRWVERTG